MASRGAAGLRGLLARGRSAALPSRGGGPPGGFFGEGTKERSHGLLFGETPPPPGQSRKWESWEAPWCGPNPNLALSPTLPAAHGARQAI